MPKNTARYLVEKPGRGAPRFFWQPGRHLRAAGWSTVALKDTDGKFLPRHMALAEAEKLNDTVATWRAGMVLTEEEQLGLPAGKGTVAALIDAYETSDHFRGLAAKTRKGYTACLKTIRAEMGERQVFAITPAGVADFLAKFKATPVQRSHIHRNGRAMWSWGRRKDLAPEHTGQNPWSDQDIPEGCKKQGIWTPEQIGIFVKAADSYKRDKNTPVFHSIGTAVVINHWIGQNTKDIIHLTRVNYVGGRFSLHRAKTGTAINMPHSQLVATRIRQEYARQEERGIASTRILVAEHTGRPWRQYNFNHVFAEIRAVAAEKDPAIADLKFFWLRHTAITELDDAGCTEREIAGITGHSGTRIHAIIDRYGHRTDRMAENAVKKRLAAARKKNR